MKPIFLILLVLALVSEPAYSQPVITTADLDSLRLPASLSELISQLESRIVYAKDLLRERKWGIVRAYYGFQTGRKELGLLSVEAGNLWKIYALNLNLAEKGEITDIQLLNSHNSYLAKEVSRISKIAECRNLILEIARLCNLDIVIKEKGDGQKEKNDKTPD